MYASVYMVVSENGSFYRENECNPMESYAFVIHIYTHKMYE